MAHAVWIQSDLPIGEALVPVAVTEQSGQRKLERFNASSAESAITGARAAMHNKAGVTWALAYSTYEDRTSGRTSYITVEASAPRMAEPAIFRYQFQTKDGHFALVEGPTLVLPQPKADAERQAAIVALKRGIASHPKASPLWTQWEKR